MGSIHWGNLWRVPIKLVDELTFKETMALGQAARAELERSGWNEHDCVNGISISRQQKSTQRALGVTVLVISCCVTNYIQLP